MPPAPVNEPNLTYAPGSAERDALAAELLRQEATEHPMDAYIGGEWVAGGGAEIAVVQPHDHAHTLGVLKSATQADAQRAIDAAVDAAPDWRAMPFDERAAILLKAAELLAGPWRQRINAATVLGQSKTAFQAEIDAACELIDFWRFNVHYANQILAEQPIANSPGIWNRTDYRPLEGFVYAITPFNFTAIAGNLPTAPALMGNTVVWKPSPSQQHSASLLMELLVEAGMPPGVINMLPGHGLPVSEVALVHPDLAGIHFTGSTPTFQHLWQTVGANLPSYKTYPRLVGETGGKDFVIAHPSADPAVVTTALIRGAFEYQGQKCSAASRAYVPRSVWERMGDDLIAKTDALSMGDPTDFSHFLGAVIDDRAFKKHTAAIERAKATSGLQVVAGGTTDDSVGWFVRPTIVVGEDPADEMFTHRVLRSDPGDPRLRRRRLREGRDPGRVRVAVRPDRRDHRPGPGSDPLGPGDAAVRRRQLLHQRQAHRCRRRPAAVRRRSRVGHQRQGRRREQPAPLDLPAVDQGDPVAPDRPHLPLHGLTAPAKLGR